MSIYATLWRLQFPRYGDAYVGREWVDVLAQGVPAPLGTPTPGYGRPARRFRRECALRPCFVAFSLANSLP